MRLSGRAPPDPITTRESRRTGMRRCRARPWHLRWLQRGSLWCDAAIPLHLPEAVLGLALDVPSKLTSRAERVVWAAHSHSYWLHQVGFFHGRSADQLQIRSLRLVFAAHNGERDAVGCAHIRERAAQALTAVGWPCDLRTLVMAANRRSAPVDPVSYISHITLHLAHCALFTAHIVCPTPHNLHATWHYANPAHPTPTVSMCTHVRSYNIHLTSYIMHLASYTHHTPTLHLAAHMVCPALHTWHAPRHYIHPARLTFTVSGLRTPHNMRLTSYLSRLTSPYLPHLTLHLMYPPTSPISPQA